jgi:hypothetical protein
MVRTNKKNRRSLEPSKYLRSGERYEQHYAAFGNIPHMRGIEIFLSSKNRSDLDKLVAAAFNQEDNEEMSIDLRALAIVEVEGSTVVFVDRLVAICKKSGKTWFEFNLDGRNVKTDWDLYFKSGSRMDMERGFNIKADLH